VKVLYFTRDYTPHDFRFLSSLGQTAHEIYSLRLEKRGNLLEQRPLPASVKMIEWAGGRGTVSWRDAFSLREGLRRVIRELQPDVVHAGSIQTAALLAAFSGFHPLVSMSWGSDLLKDADRNFWWNQATRYTLRHTDVLVGDCEAVKQKSMELGFSSERVVLFPWGIDLDQYSPGKGQIREALGWQKNHVILSLRSWEPIYGVDVVARAFVKALNINPDLRLILLGDGSQSELIHTIFEESGVKDQVYFGGRVSNDKLPDYYRSADVYLSASYSDGSSVSLMEALGCGIPVLLSDIPGNLEWIKHGQEGWFFPTGDDLVLADRIVKSAQIDIDRLQMHRAARALAEKRADWNKNFERLLSAYQLAIKLNQ
jgi:glycosyltransferase involved in cell wall biosynthesis